MRQSSTANSFLSLGSALLYGTTAVTMNFVNKYTMQIYPLPNVVMVLQMAATWAIIHLLLVLGYLNFPKFSWSKCRQLFFITVLYTANTMFALVGLKTLNVPMYNTLKRLTPIIVLACKACLRKQMPQTQITLSVLLVVAGCIVAGIGDLTFNAFGYLFALLSCLAQAAYLLLVEFQGAEGMMTSELLYYNAVTSLPLLVCVVVISGEANIMVPKYQAEVLQQGAVWVWSVLLSCSLIGCLLNYALFLCTLNNSALTTTIVGVLKGVVAVVLGFFLLGGVPVSAVNITGITLNTIGGIWYTMIKFQQRQWKKTIVASASVEPLGGRSMEANFQLPIANYPASDHARDLEASKLLLIPIGQDIPSPKPGLGPAERLVNNRRQQSPH